MNTPLSSFFRLNKTQLHTHKFRGLITGAGVMSYYLAVYFLLPQYFPSRDSIVPENLLNPDNIYSTALSLGPILAGSLAFSLPALVGKLRKGKDSAKPTATSSAISPAPIEPASIGSGTPQSVSSILPTTEQKPASAEPGQSAEKIAAMVEEIVSGKVAEMTNEVTIFKKDAASMKEDVEKVKMNIETLTVSLESSLTDMKAFQAEMVNPLNFMRKYFETMDIKNLSDPTLGLPPLTPSLLADKGPAVPATIEGKISEPKLEAGAVDSALAHDCDPADNKSVDIAHATSISTMTPSNLLHAGVEKQQPRTEESGGTPEDIGELLDGKLTLGKMMAMAPVLEKILRDIGSEGVDAMVDQYRLLGLKPDEERAMYNLVFMLKNFNMSSDDVVSKLYRLGQVVGIQDPQADLEYSKMQARKKTLTQKVNAGKPTTSPAPKSAAESAGSATSVKSTPVTIRRGA